MLLVKNISEPNEQLHTASSKTLLRGGIGSAIIKLTSAALSFGMFLFAGRALTLKPILSLAWDSLSPLY